MAARLLFEAPSDGRFSDHSAPPRSVTDCVPSALEVRPPLPVEPSPAVLNVGDDWRIFKSE